MTTAVKLAPQELVKEAFALAKMAAPALVMPAIVFVVAASSYAAALLLSPGLTALVMLMALFAAGIYFSREIYGEMLGVKRGSLLQLAHVNVSIYIVFFIMGVLMLAFLSILPGILMQTMGYDISADTDPDLVREYFIEMMGTAYGMFFALVCLLAAGVLVFIAVRLLLAGAATIATGQTHVFRSWRWTEGHAITIAIAAVFTHVTLFLASFGLNILLPTATSGTGLRLAGSVLGSVLLLPFIVVGHGLAVAVYRRLVPEN